MRASKIVTRFKGLSQLKSAASSTMDEALGMVNCLVSGGGFLEKMRVPLPIAAPLPQSSPASMWEFQQGNGTRQIIVCVGTQIWNFTGDQLVAALIDDNPLNAAPWSCVESNNLLFMANGSRMLKWTGTALQAWGIPKPPTPTVGVVLKVLTIQRTANVVTLTFNTGGSTPPETLPSGWSPQQLLNFSVGGFITVQGAFDATMNGTFVIASSPSAFTVTYASVAPDSGPFAAALAGTATIYYLQEANVSTFYNVVSVGRASGVSTISFAVNESILVGEQFTLSGFTSTDANFNGTWICSAVDSGFNRVSFLQTGIPDRASGAPIGSPVVAAGFTYTVSGRQWRYAWKNSVTQHEGTASEASVTLPGGGVLSNVRAYLTASVPTDPQIDTIVWYATLDSNGSEYFFQGEYPISCKVLGDAKPQELLNKQRRAQLINDPPPLGKYLTLWQGRIFVAGVVGFPQDIAYSGYERIFVGRPEESFPPNNRLRLAIGADDVRAMGAIHSGLVAWSHSNEMFMYRGVVEDIVIDTPVNFTAYLDQLPWNQGANSHYSVQPTPYGVVWLASDNSVDLWTGGAGFLTGPVGPKQISDNIAPLLARLTDSQKQFATSAWLNYLDTDWYVLLISIDNASYNNRILFFDLSPDPEQNAGIWISDATADAIMVHEDSQGGKHLLIMQSGTMKEVFFQSPSRNGLLLKPGLDVIGGLTTSLVAGANAIPVGNYYLRLVRYDRVGGEMAMSDELGPFNNGGTNVLQISQVPATADVFRWRVYFGTASGQLSQYVDNDPAAVAAAGYVVSVSGTPLAGDAPLQRSIPAFWHGGYFGNESAQEVKMFRDGQLVASQTGFSLQVALVDDETYTFEAPLNLTPDIDRRSHYSINWKARRMSPTIVFPNADLPANVQMLSASHNPGAQR